MSSKLWEYGEDKYEDPSANPNSLLQDFWFYDADTSSHANEPEHQITHINEYVENDKAWYADMKKQYENIAYSGLICQSTKEISQFSNFSAYMEHGISALSLRDGDYKSTANFPDIAYDLLTNRRYGVGEYVGNNSVDKARMFVASKFCYANDLFGMASFQKRSTCVSFSTRKPPISCWTSRFWAASSACSHLSPITQTSRLTLGQRQVSKTSPSLDCSRMGTSGTSGQHSFHQKSASCLSQS